MFLFLGGGGLIAAAAVSFFLLLIRGGEGGYWLRQRSVSIRALSSNIIVSVVPSLLRSFLNLWYSVVFCFKEWLLLTHQCRGLDEESLSMWTPTAGHKESEEEILETAEEKTWTFLIEQKFGFQLESQHQSLIWSCELMSESGNEGRKHRSDLITKTSDVCI